MVLSLALGQTQFPDVRQVYHPLKYPWTKLRGKYFFFLIRMQCEAVRDEVQATHYEYQAERAVAVILDDTMSLGLPFFHDLEQG
jgi:hypothetical protein